MVFVCFKDMERLVWYLVVTNACNLLFFIYLQERAVILYLLVYSKNKIEREEKKYKHL